MTFCCVHLAGPWQWRPNGCDLTPKKIAKSLIKKENHLNHPPQFSRFESFSGRCSHSHSYSKTRSNKVLYNCTIRGVIIVPASTSNCASLMPTPPSRKTWKDVAPFPQAKTPLCVIQHINAHTGNFPHLWQEGFFLFQPFIEVPF